MITSKSNEYIKHIKQLSQKKYRDEFGEFLVEGVKIVNEAITEKMDISRVIVSEDFDGNINYQNVEVVSKDVFEYISDTKTPQGVLAIIKQKQQETVTGSIIFVLDDVQDPGNVGTIIRTLDAAGIHDLVVSDKCADIYNPKVVRSTMGGIYRVNVKITNNMVQELKDLQNDGYRIMVTTLEGTKSIYQTNFLEEKIIIVIGNESKGIEDSIIKMADINVKIPMLGKCESLNAGVAASIIAYEYVRQSLSK